jgi:hypothetical protein
MTKKTIMTMIAMMTIMMTTTMMIARTRILTATITRNFSLTPLSVDYHEAVRWRQVSHGLGALSVTASA